MSEALEVLREKLLEVLALVASQEFLESGSAGDCGDCVETSCLSERGIKTFEIGRLEPEVLDESLDQEH